MLPGSKTILPSSANLSPTYFMTTENCLNLRYEGNKKQVVIVNSSVVSGMYVQIIWQLSDLQLPSVCMRLR